MTKEKRKGGIILQVAILFALSIVAMGIILLYDEKKVMSIIESDHE